MAAERAVLLLLIPEETDAEQADQVDKPLGKASTTDAIIINIINNWQMIVIDGKRNKRDNAAFMIFVATVKVELA